MTLAKPSDSILECADCRTVAPAGAPFCDACGGHDFRSRQESRFAYDAIAVFIGVVAVLLYWIARS